MLIQLYPAHSFHQLGRRSNQEDARFPDVDFPAAESRTFVVCDGVGGLACGEIASNTVAASIGAAMTAFGAPETVFTAHDFADVLARAYSALESRAGSSAMATTLTFVHFHAGGAFTAHIGDSRIYHIRPGVGILHRTYDHSLVNALVRSGNLSPADAPDHPKGNVITRCMGGRDLSARDAATAYDIADIQADDCFFLCTDGVLHCIDEEGLCELLESSRPDREKMDVLAQMCASSSDNNTATLIRVASVTDPDREDTDLDDDEELPAGTPTRILSPLPPMSEEVAPAFYGGDDTTWSASDEYQEDEAYGEDDDEADDDRGPGGFFRRFFS